MNQISLLTKNISGLQKLEPAIVATEALHWKSREVYNTALLVRNTFDTFEQKWRDMLQRNKFFVFCFPKYPVMTVSGQLIFHYDHIGGDEVNQTNFEDGCLVLKHDLTRIRKAMQDERTSLLSLQNHSSLAPVFTELDELSEQLDRVRRSADPEKAIQDWDDLLRSKMKKHDLDQGFNTAFGDRSKAPPDRIARRELALGHIADSLSAGPIDNKNGRTTVNNFGNNNTIGLFNTGDHNEFEQITVNINILALNHSELAESLERITFETQNADVDVDTKEQVIDAVLTVSTELTKPKEKQRLFKIEDPWKKLEILTKVGDLAVKVHPLLADVWHQIQHQFPHLFG